MPLEPVAPLNGFAVGVTAARRAAEQIRLLTERGARVVHGPTLECRPFASERSIASSTRRLSADPPDVAVFMTGLGTHLWFEAADRLGLGERLATVIERAEVGARGPKAAAALLSAGVGADWIAEPARSDEVVARLADRGVVGAHVVMQTDGEGSRSIGARVEALGARVTLIAPYRWTLPDDHDGARALVEAVCDRAVDVVTFTSRPALRNLLEVAAEMDVRDQIVRALQRDVVAACIGPVCADEAAADGVQTSIQPDRLELAALVDEVAAVLSSRASVFDLAGHRVHRQGCLIQIDDLPAVAMTVRERQVFDLLSQRPGVVISKNELLRTIWPGSDSEHHTVEVTVSRLRRRFGDAGDCIETVIRRGYRLAAG